MFAETFSTKPDAQLLWIWQTNRALLWTVWCCFGGSAGKRPLCWAFHRGRTHESGRRRLEDGGALCLGVLSLAILSALAMHAMLPSLWRSPRPGPCDQEGSCLLAASLPEPVGASSCHCRELCQGGCNTQVLSHPIRQRHDDGPLGDERFSLVAQLRRMECGCFLILLRRVCRLQTCESCVISSVRHERWPSCVSHRFAHLTA
jgi:hypothetical protein